jgi:hypothetical protein
MANGHPRAMRYTPLQAMTFYQLANLRIENKFKQQSIAVRYAVWSDDDKFGKWLKQP